jgi:DNA-binding MarR family transcriptional regulator
MSPEVTDDVETPSTRGRQAVLSSVLGRLESDECVEADYDALTQLLLDATLADDGATLAVAFKRLRRLQALALPVQPDTTTSGDGERLGRIRGLIAVAGAALQRLTPSSVVREVAANSHAHRMLAALGERASMTTGDIGAALHVDASQISRTGGRLLAQRLVVRTRAGKKVYWELSTRGRSILTRLGSPQEAAPAGNDYAAAGQEASDWGLVAQAEHVRGGAAPTELTARQQQLLRQALRESIGIDDPAVRVHAFRHLVPHLPHELLLEALASAKSIEEPEPRARAVSDVAHQLVRRTGREAVTTMRAVDSDTGALTFAVLAGHLFDDAGLCRYEMEMHDDLW